VIVLDASAAVQACLAADGFDLFGHERLIAPALLLSEVSSALHEMRWRKEISAGLADIAFERLLAAPVSPRSSKRLRRDAWRVAEELGWMKTYDAEYVALARTARCRLFTLDARLRRGAGHVVPTIGPGDL
jgi:predicted nucleic acid-binding protein